MSVKTKELWWQRVMMSAIFNLPYYQCCFYYYFGLILVALNGKALDLFKIQLSTFLSYSISSTTRIVKPLLKKLYDKYLNADIPFERQLGIYNFWTYCWIKKIYIFSILYIFYYFKCLQMYSFFQRSWRLCSFIQPIQR